MAAAVLPEQYVRVSEREGARVYTADLTDQGTIGDSSPVGHFLHFDVTEDLVTRKGERSN